MREHDREKQEVLEKKQEFLKKFRSNIYSVSQIVPESVFLLQNDPTVCKNIHISFYFFEKKHFSDEESLLNDILEEKLIIWDVLNQSLLISEFSPISPKIKCTYRLFNAA